MVDTIAGLSTAGPRVRHKQDVTLLCEEFPQRENGRMETIYQNERRPLTASRTDVVLCIFDHLKIHWSIICTFVCWWIHYLERRDAMGDLGKCFWIEDIQGEGVSRVERGDGRKMREQSGEEEVEKEVGALTSGCHSWLKPNRKPFMQSQDQHAAHCQNGTKRRAEKGWQAG